MSNKDEIISIEWTNSKRLQRIEFLLGFMLLVSLVIIALIFPAQQLLAALAFGMVIIWFIVAGIDAVVEKNNYLENIGLGRNGKVALAAFFAAVLIATFSQVLPLQTTSLLYLASTTPTSINYTSDWNLIWIAGIFAIAEEMFFRNTIVPVLGKLTGMKFFSITVGNVMFAIAHLAAVTATLTLKYGIVTPEQLLIILFSDFAFGMACSLGDGLAKTTAWGYGLHVIYNGAKIVSGRGL